MPGGDSIDRILEKGKDIEFSITEDKGTYDIRARFNYKDSKVDMLVESVETHEELGKFYVENLSGIDSPDIVYGSSNQVKQKLIEKDTWALARSGEWAVNPQKALTRHMEDITYREVIDHTSASALTAAVFSESDGEERTETYRFYIDTIRGLESKEKPGGVIGKAKKKAKDKAKDKTKNVAKNALEDAEAEFKRLEEEGKIDEAKKKAKDKTKQVARKKISEAKENTKQRTQNKLIDVKNRADSIGKKVKTFSPLYVEKTDYEGPEPNAKIEMEDGVTVYYYGDEYLEFLEED